MRDRAELIDVAIEQYIDSLELEDQQALLRDYLSDEMHSESPQSQERFITLMQARELVAEQEDSD